MELRRPGDEAEGAKRPFPWWSPWKNRSRDQNAGLAEGRKMAA